MGADKTLKACDNANMSSTACTTLLIIPTELFQDNFTVTQNYFRIYCSSGYWKRNTVEYVSHHDEELSSHDSLSDDKLQEVQNDHATYTNGFARKKISKMTIISIISLGIKKCMTHVHTGTCVKSVRCSMGNHQCQQEREEVVGFTAW